MVKTRGMGAILALLLAFPLGLSGLTINRLNGGANIIYIDFSIPGRVVPLELVRSYNSITALSEASGWSGAFGWGWTSPFETTLTVTPERHVLLRDGGSGNSVVFKPEKEDPRVRDEFFESVRVAHFERQRGKKLSPQELGGLKLPDKMVTRLKTEPAYRNEIAAKYALQVRIPMGEVLVSSEYGYQTIQFKDNQWVRDRDGVRQVFDSEGRLVRQIDRTGFQFLFKYSAQNRSQIVEISDPERSMSYKFNWRQDRVVEVSDNRNLRARYTYDGAGNLSQVIDSNNQTFGYKYENRKFPHLLTKIEYPSEALDTGAKIFRDVQYDDNGLVVRHREKDATEVSFTYGRSPSDAENNFWTKSVRKLADGSADEQYDEYFLKGKPDGTKYLYKQENRSKGVTTVTVFNPCCGKPLQLVRNGEVTNFKYFENGLLMERVGPKEDLKLEYDPRWKKVSRVSQNGLVSSYEYDVRGNLVRASNTRDEKVTLSYDRFGRILQMRDGTKRLIGFRYGQHGKPEMIEEKGVGKIKISYGADGRIQGAETFAAGAKSRVPSDSRSQEVVRRVMKGFQQLLDIIRPAGISLTANPAG